MVAAAYPVDESSRTDDGTLTILGEISAHHGVRGWVRIRSHTRPAEEILEYARWTLVPGERRGLRGGQSGPRARTLVAVVETRRQKNGLLARLDGIGSREDAEPLIGAHIAVPRAELPALPEGEFYWEQLIGLDVINLEGEDLGKVDHLLETGANDVLVVRRELPGSESEERLLPWAANVIRRVDLEAGRLLVEWGLDY